MNKLEQLKQANITYENHKQIADEKYLEMEKIGDSFTREEFEVMDYETLKENKGLITYAISYDSGIELIFEEVYNKKRLEKYPQLRKACYYPELNEIDFLTEKEIKGLDNYLCRIATRGYISTSCSAWNEMVGLKDYDKINKLKDRLVELGIATRSYKISCGCGSWECEDKIKTEEEKEKFFNYHNNKQGDWLEDGYFTVYCDRAGDEIEINSIEKWESHLEEIYYKVIKKPNRECDKL